jgi:beta-lactamase class A
MSNTLRRLNIAALVVLVLLCAALVICLLVNKCRADAYALLNPQLLCVDRPVVAKHGYSELKRSLLEYIQLKREEQAVTQVSVYFRDLQYGPTLGIDEHEQFTPASLLKLPVMLAYLSLSEQDPGILQRRIIALAASSDFVPAFEPEHSVVAGQSYTVEEYLRYMIQYSDNNAYFTLFVYLKELSTEGDLLEQTLVDLGIATPESATDEVISVKAYASIFAQLFHVSFLQNKELSQFALELLANSDFENGLKAGVPTNVRVANKFGERYGFDQEFVQLHDCGIVYYPENAYVLCVMTRGTDFSELSAVITDISGMFYAELEDRTY